jgi:hypothetical protein
MPNRRSDAVIGWLDRFLGDGGSARPDLGREVT